ncbi:MAG: hypothetical protein WCA11_08485, partial [Terracidiphilus sp.]
EDKESALGRPLTTGELEDWLKKMGSPIMVAARYQPQQYLIGPAIFPVYWYVMRLVLLWAVIIYAIVNAVVIPFVTPNGSSVLDAVLRAPGILVTVAGWVTLIFAIIEFIGARHPEKCPPIAGLAGNWSSGAWNPGALPPLENTTANGRKPRSYATAVAEVVFGFILLIWLLLIPRHPFLLMGPGIFYLNASPFQLADVWWVFYWWIVALNALQLAWHCIDLMRGAWQHPSPAQHVVFKAFGLIPLGLLILAPDHAYVTLRHPALDQASHGAILGTINNSIHLGLMVIAAIAVLQLIWDVAQLARAAYRKRVAAG